MGRVAVAEGVEVASATSYEISFFYRRVRCRERIPLKPSPPNLKRVIRHRAAILASIENDDFDYCKTFPNSPRRFQFLSQPQGDTVNRFLETWLTGQKVVVKASTWDDYRKIVRFTLAPTVGKLPLVDLDRAAVRQMCVGFTAGNKRIANILSVLRLALNQGVQDNVIATNVLDGWSYTKAEVIKESDDEAVDVFTVAEQVAVFAKLKPKNVNWFRFAFWSGLRTSEQIALEWRDIDFAAGTIKIVRAETAAARRAGTGPEAPKTKRGRRTVKMLAQARQALMDQRQHTALAAGRVWHLNTDEAVREVWKLACEKAGVRYRNPYQTRHTYASMLLSAGENPVWVSTQLGHADLGMVNRVYGHFIPGTNPDAGAATEHRFAHGT